VAEEAQLATAAPSAGDPVPLGLLVFALGSTVLGISLLGYVPLAVQGNTIMPIVFAGTGLGLLITTTWAARIGETFVATVLGAFAAFWISYAALVIGLAHNWYAIPPTAILHTIGQFLIAWDVVIFMLFLVSLRIPLLFSLILGAGVVGVTSSPSACLSHPRASSTRARCSCCCSRPLGTTATSARRSFRSAASRCRSASRP
jgi:succinate-acetate transporter protein